MNSNRSESWIAVKRGTEDLVGTSNFFFDRFSTFYNFHLGRYTIPNGQVAANNQVQGYRAQPSAPRRCRRAGPTTPTRTSRSTPRAAPTRSRSRQRVLAEPAFRTPRSCSPTATTWAGTGSPATAAGRWSRCRRTPRACSSGTSRTSSGWLSTTFPATASRTTCTRPGPSSTARPSRSGWQSPATRPAFRPGLHAQRPSQVGPGVTYVYPAVDAAGTCYVSVVSLPPSGKASSIYVGTGPPTTVARGAGSWQRCRTWASCRRPPCRIPPSGTGSWRTSPRAGRTPATCT